MHRIINFRLLSFAAALFLLAACGPSRQTTVDYETAAATSVSFNKLMVFAQVEDSFNRRMIEVGIAHALQQRGMNAHSTYRTIAGPKDSTATALVQNVLKQRADGLLLLTNVKDAPTTAAPTAFGLINFGTTIPLTGGITQNDVLHIEASLYRLGATQNLWRMDFSQRVGDNIKLLGDAIDTAVVNGLMSSGVVRNKKRSR